MSTSDRALVALTRSFVENRPVDPATDPDALIAIARRNLVLIRLAEKAPDAAGLQAAVGEDRARVQYCVRLIEEVSVVCERAGIPHVFPKAFQHYPDMGHDVDLLVAGDARDVDRALIDGLRASRTAPGTFDRISGKTGLWRADWPAPIEIHHGRLGQVGEQVGFAAEVLVNRRRATIAGVTTWVPAADDEVLIQAYQRVCCHLSLRLSDVIRGAAFKADSRIDWQHVADKAKRHGLNRAVSVYFSHVAKITAAAADATTPRIRNGQYAVGVAPVASAYAVEIGMLVTRHEVSGLLRLVTIPFGVAVACALAITHAIRPSRSTLPEGTR